MKGKKALFVVDVQRDFCEGGSLAVKAGDEVVEPINRLVRLFTKKSIPVVFTRDWHPRNHCSFIAYGGPWPPHCVMGTPGASFHQSLEVPREALVVNKATDPEREAYSGFQGTNLAGDLSQLGVRELFVGGLTTDYCVKNTVLDALRSGFEVYVLTDCVRGVNLKPADSTIALRAMVAEGAKKLTSGNLARRLNRRVAVSSSS